MLLWSGGPSRLSGRFPSETVRRLRTFVLWTFCDKFANKITFFRRLLLSPTRV